ncbi:YqjK-like family protein [Serratia marcescens]|nr:YqjK-like family protein [Serratia marcescens]
MLNWSASHEPPPLSGMEKERLIRQIQQQRLDLAEHKSLWLEKTERIDRGWQTVFGLRRYLVLGSSVMALYGIRHPSKMIRWSRRAFGAWSAIRLFKKTFSAK